jgi:hypothetical protein
MPAKSVKQETEGTFAPKSVQGEEFDVLMKRLVRVSPDKPKKASKPKKKQP